MNTTRLFGVTVQVMYLKGPALCPGSPFNLQYTLGEERDGFPSLVGFFHTDIYWNNTRDAWIMKSLKVIASLEY